jgi:caffeoyl-CoA O-methyltransferase
MSDRSFGLDDRVYDYLLAVSVREYPAQRDLRAATADVPDAIMQVSPEQGQFMGLLIELIGARRAIEVGTFTGYSALAIALALPDDGQLIACDINDDYTRIGQPFWEQAGVAGKIDLRLAPALDTLDGLLADGEATRFDFAFIDADKGNYDAYYERCLELVRKGGLIAIDNVLWGGKVADPDIRDADTSAIRALNKKLKGDPRVSISMLTIGDGLTLARKR